MRTSLIAVGFLAFGLTQCSGERGLFVGDERPDAGEGGDGNENGGSDSGGMGGSAVRGGSGSGAEAGEPSSGGSVSRGGSGSGAEAGEPGTGGVAAGGGSDAGGSAGEGGAASRGGMGGSGAEAGSGTAARGGTSDGGRAGAAGGGGSGGVDCNALAREYIERLALAQQCSPILTYEQCTTKIADDFFCPCPTFVNPARQGDINRLNQILEYARQCARVCPAIVCPNPTRGTCSADAIVAADGRCTNVL